MTPIETYRLHVPSIARTSATFRSMQGAASQIATGLVPIVVGMPHQRINEGNAFGQIKTFFQRAHEAKWRSAIIVQLTKEPHRQVVSFSGRRGRKNEIKETVEIEKVTGENPTDQSNIWIRFLQTQQDRSVKIVQARIHSDENSKLHVSQIQAPTILKGQPLPTELLEGMEATFVTTALTAIESFMETIPQEYEPLKDAPLSQRKSV